MRSQPPPLESSLRSHNWREPGHSIENPDGRAGHEGGEGTFIYLWLTRVDTQKKTTKAIILQLKQKQTNKQKNPVAKKKRKSELKEKSLSPFSRTMTEQAVRQGVNVPPPPELQRGGTRNGSPRLSPPHPAPLGPPHHFPNPGTQST